MTLLQPLPLRDLIHEIAHGQGYASSQSCNIEELSIGDSSDGFSVSYGQEQMLIIHELLPDSTAYSVPLALHIKG